jgi:ubiquinone biosynthesis protein UbiJ
MNHDLLLGSAVSAAIEAAINRAIELDPVGGARRRELEGSVLRIEPSDLGFSLCLVFEAGRIRVEQDPEALRTADAVVRGPLAAIVRDLGRDAETEVVIEGDIELAHAAKQLFTELEPDLEEALASLIGDRGANIVGGAVREGVKLTRAAIDALVRSRPGDDDGAP